MSNYPRDMIGYGHQMPNSHWPDDAKIALQFVINYEEGGENCILHGDPASEAFLSCLISPEKNSKIANITCFNQTIIYTYCSGIKIHMC